MNVDVIPSYLYTDPLLSKKDYLVNDEITEPSNSMDMQVSGDPILDAYITQLDEETFNKRIDLIDEAIWNDFDLGNVYPRVIDLTRTHGWAVVVKRDDDFLDVFSVAEFNSWVFSDGKVIGVDVSFSNFDGTSVAGEQLIFGTNCVLFKHKRGDRVNFAYSDISLSLQTLTVMARQIKGQMDFVASKSGFLHYIYGTAASSENIENLDQKLADVDMATGIGASKSVLEEIKLIETNKNIDASLKAYDKNLQLISGKTHLPISFFQGERSSGGGLNGNADTVDLVKIDRKKENLFNHYEGYMRQVLDMITEGSWTTPFEYESEISIEDVEEKTEDEQTDKETDSRTEDN